MSHRLVAVLFGVSIAISLACSTAAAADDFQPAARVYTLSSGRLGAVVAALVGLTGVVVGGLALRPDGRLGAGSGRLGAALALAAGLIGTALGGLVAASADGGVGAGNGRGGAIVALVVGLISMALGALALARRPMLSLRDESASSIEGDPGAKPGLLTRVRLACGVAAGPIYVTATMAQALTRDGFDLRRHRFSWLTTGELGWIHRSNMVLVGVATVLFAVGVRQVLRTGRGAVWGPRLLGLFGAAYILGGLLTADPVAGFPPGATPEMVQTTWHGAVQNASRGASTLLLIAACLVLATRLAAKGRQGWACFTGAAFPMVLAALTAVGFVVTGHSSSAFALAILTTPWILVTALAVHLYRGETDQRDDVPTGLGTRSRPVVGHAPPS